MKAEELVISARNVSKCYEIGSTKDDTLRGSISNVFRGKPSSKEDFWALKDINFDIYKGEVVGIVGKNGAGKSTLLKVLSQITRPSTGRIEIEGHVASLLEVGTGFHPELTGRENVYLNGTILGMSRKEVKKKFDEIVAFSGVEKFIDTPVKHYSSGMYVRLAFAVAAHLEPEILIIDEVLAVGDVEFQKKCLGKMKDVSQEGRTILFVSHNMAAVKELCTRGILLKNGEIIGEGSAVEIVDQYLRTYSDREEVNLEKKPIGNDIISLQHANAEPISGDLITIGSGTKLNIEFEIELENINLAMAAFIVTPEEFVVTELPCIISTESDSKKGGYSIHYTIPPHTLNAGEYYINLVFARDQREVLFQCERACSFEILNEGVGSNYNKLPGILALRTKPEIMFKPKVQA